MSEYSHSELTEPAPESFVSYDKESTGTGRCQGNILRSTTKKAAERKRMIYIISITTGPEGISINKENGEVLQVKLFGQNGQETKWVNCSIGSSFKSSTLEAFEIEAPEIGSVKFVKVRLNNQVNYHQNLTHQELTGLFVSSENDAGKFYYNSSERSDADELRSGALYKIVLHSNCGDEIANSGSKSEELFLQDDAAKRESNRVELFNQHSTAPFHEQKAIFFTSGAVMNKFAKYKIVDQGGEQPSYLKSFLVQTSSSAGLEGIEWESPVTVSCQIKCSKTASRKSSFESNTSEDFSQITPFVAPAKLEKAPEKADTSDFPSENFSYKSSERPVFARPLQISRPSVPVLQESNRALPAEFSDLGVLKKCKVRKRNLEGKVPLGGSRWSSSIHLYENVERRGNERTVICKEDTKVEPLPLAPEIPVEEDGRYHSDVVIKNHEEISRASSDSNKIPSTIYRFEIKTAKKFFSNSVTQATLVILNEDDDRLEFFLTNEKHLKKREKGEPIALDGIYANQRNEYSFEVVDSFGKISQLNLDLAKNLSVEYIRLYEFEDSVKFTEIPISFGGKQKLYKGVNCFPVLTAF